MLGWDALKASDIGGRARAFQSLVGAGMDVAKAAAQAGVLSEMIDAARTGNPRAAAQKCLRSPHKNTEAAAELQVSIAAYWKMCRREGVPSASDRYKEAQLLRRLEAWTSERAAFNTELSRGFWILSSHRLGRSTESTEKPA